MSRNVLYCLLLFTGTLFISCEKVIDLNLKGVENKYVIEAIVTDKAGDCRVLITQTKDFDENNDFLGVNGASVRITDKQTGEFVLLDESTAGTYTSPSFIGLAGHDYLLEVKIGEQVFTANSSMPQKVHMDTVFVSEENLFGEIWKLSNISFQDPGETVNHYRYVQYINGVKTEQIYVRDDKLVNGRQFSTLLYMDPDIDEEDRINSGDEVEIEMQCINDDIYMYWYSLEQSATGETNAATPANPVSNIKGGALGYFSTHTSQNKKILVP